MFFCACDSAFFVFSTPIYFFTLGYISIPSIIYFYTIQTKQTKNIIFTQTILSFMFFQFFFFRRFFIFIVCYLFPFCLILLLGYLLFHSLFFISISPPLCFALHRIISVLCTFIFALTLTLRAVSW